MSINYDTLVAYINGLNASGGLTDADYNQIILYILANGNLENSPRDLIQIRRGNVANLPVFAQGEPGLCLDTEDFYIGGANGNIKFANESNIMRKVGGGMQIVITNPPAPLAAATVDADDNSAAIQACADYLSANGGGILAIPVGTFKFATTLNLHPKTILTGCGRKTSVLMYTGTGDGVKTTSSINTSTPIDVLIRDVAIGCNNVGNTGGGYVDVGGSFIYVNNAYLFNFKYNIIFDQTEIAKIENCEFLGGSMTTASIWLVNGADHTPGASLNFTNRIKIDNNQFNSVPGTHVSIIDEGGACHTITDNNFNAGATGLYVCGVSGLVVSGNEFEAHSVSDITMSDTKKIIPAYVAECNGFNITANVAISGDSNMVVQAGTCGQITGNMFGQAAQCINFTNGASNHSAGIVIENNAIITRGTARSNGYMVYGFSRSVDNNIIRQKANTYVALEQATGTLTVTPANMSFITAGCKLTCINEDGTNSEDIVVTSVTATTFTAPFTSSKAANWRIIGS